ncbi:MAG: TetR/AcrR family transcriptional regulator [Magnetococcales bacterium]|nr:TetR/AcrR family transcriptional regulator [Magnetococcales bacterium]
MARRTDHSRDELSDFILDEAQKIIEDKGVAALTARSIASAIGYSPGTLYNIFANIDEIILHLNARTMDDLQHKLLHAVQQSSSDRAKLDKMITAYIKYNKTSRQRWNLLFEHRLPQEQTLPEWYQEQHDELLDLIATTIRTLLPDCGEKEIKHSARVLWSGLYGICSIVQANTISGVSAKSVDEMARSLVYNYISGLKRAGI